MIFLRIALLCLLTALLPLDGFARAAAGACAAHRGDGTVPMRAAPAMAQDHHVMHDGTMMADGIHAAQAMPHGGKPQVDKHDGCRCAGVCAAHCTTGTAMAPIAVPLHLVRGEAPLNHGSLDPQPARRLDLLRPPAGTRV